MGCAKDSLCSSGLYAVVLLFLTTLLLPVIPTVDGFPLPDPYSVLFSKNKPPRVPSVGGALNSPSTCLLGSSSQQQDSDNDTNNSLEQDALILEQRLKNLFANQPDKAAASAAEIQNILQRSPSNTADNGDANRKLPNENDSETEGVFLDPDVYARSRDLLGQDGSLNLASASSLNNNARSGEPKRDPRKAIATDFLESFARPPRSTRSKSDEATSMTDLLDAMRKQQQELDSSDPEGSEKLHQQVLASEEGFQKQSKLFRESLVDSSKSMEAAEFRNGEAFRQRHIQAMASLDNQLAEFEASLNNLKVENPCAKCGCELTPDEMKYANKQQTEAICRICLSEDIYRKHKVNDRRSPPAYPSNRYSSSARSFRPSPYASPYSGVYSQKLNPPTTTSSIPQEFEQTRKTQPTSQFPPANESPRPSKQRPRSSMKKLPNSTLQRTSSSTFSTGANQSRPQRGTSLNQRPPGLENPSSGPRDTSLPRSNERIRDKKWVKVEDPDSGETFYWNTETDEMEWDVQ
eukprot:scaffold2479_cov151-Amphora_coffeaeformis.AAC.4